MAKKAIIIPKVENKGADKEEQLTEHATGIIKKKKDNWSKIRAKNSYIRIFLEHLLPDPGHYDCDKEDLTLIDQLNYGKDKSSKEWISNEEFAATIITWEETTNVGDCIDVIPAKELVAHINPKAMGPHLETIHAHWRRLREKYKRPLLRKHWKVHYKVDDQSNMKQAFRPVKKEKMRLRKNANKSDADLLSKYEVLKKETQKAEAMINLIKYREMIKCYQNEISINNFYQHSSFKQQQNSLESLVPKLNLPITQVDTKQKFLHELKKAKQKASHMITVPLPPKGANEPTNNVGSTHNVISATNVPREKKPTHIINPIAQEKIIDNDTSYFLCSIISALDKEGLSIQDFKLSNLKQMNEKIKVWKQKELNESNTQSDYMNKQRVNNDVQVDRTAIQRLKQAKNIFKFALRKRLSPGGITFLDRITLDATMNNEFHTISGNEIPNYLWDSTSSSFDDKINQMKSVRYKGMDDNVCFDPEDDTYESTLKSLITKESFKNFIRQRKVLKTTSNYLPVSATY